MPFVPSAVFIDGQIKLNKSNHVCSWEKFVLYQYALPVKRSFELGATTVILSFDAYPWVPRAKNMTQAKRQRTVPVLDFSDVQSLPDTMPMNWQQAIMNRNFKSKVIMMVIEVLPNFLALKEGQSVYIDYHGAPMVISGPSKTRSVDERFGPLGESDIKFARYIDHFPHMLIESTDGDYLPIAMLKYEARRDADADHNTRVAIYRMTCNVAGNKRESSGKEKNRYEYVDVSKLTEEIIQKMDDIVPGQLHMPVLSIFINLTGSDFSKGLPFVGPVKIWDRLPLLAKVLHSALDRDGKTLNYDMVADHVVAPLYMAVYSKHAGTNERNLKVLMDRLKRSPGMSEKVRTALPNAAAVLCCIKNSHWVLHYWNDPENVPDLIGYGYRVDSKGRMQWEA